MNIEEKLIKAQEFYKLLSDETYLLGCDVEKETILKIVELFTESSCSKTDFVILMQLINTKLDYSKCSFYFTLDQLETTLSKPNLSRSLKNLEKNNFISKVSLKGGLSHYFFNAQFDTMIEYI